MFENFKVSQHLGKKGTMNNMFDEEILRAYDCITWKPDTKSKDSITNMLENWLVQLKKMRSCMLKSSF